MHVYMKMCAMQTIRKRPCQREAKKLKRRMNERNWGDNEMFHDVILTDRTRF